VRRHLDEFLFDCQNMGIPQIGWQPILRSVILTTGPGRLANVDDRWLAAGGHGAGYFGRPGDAHGHADKRQTTVWNGSNIA
jgi:hypothetical protein